MSQFRDMAFSFRLGLAYAGSNREDVLTLLLPVMGDSKSSMEVWDQYSWTRVRGGVYLAGRGNRNGG